MRSFFVLPRVPHGFPRSANSWRGLGRMRESRFLLPAAVNGVCVCVGAGTPRTRAVCSRSWRRSTSTRTASSSWRATATPPRCADAALPQMVTLVRNHSGLWHTADATHVCRSVQGLSVELTLRAVAVGEAVAERGSREIELHRDTERARRQRGRPEPFRPRGRTSDRPAAGRRSLARHVALADAGGAGGDLGSDLLHGRLDGGQARGAGGARARDTWHTGHMACPPLWIAPGTHGLPPL